MNKKKRGGRDRPRDRRNNDIYSDEELDNEMIDLNEIEGEMEMARETFLINSYNEFLAENVGPRVSNIRLYWIDIRNEAYSYLKTYIMEKYDNARLEETMSFDDMCSEFIDNIKININDESNTDRRGNFALDYRGELINPINYRDLYNAFETFRIYLDHLKAESDNVEFIETEMRFTIGEGSDSDEILEIINNEGQLFEKIIDATREMLEYENDLIFTDENIHTNIRNFSDDMRDGVNIIDYLYERRNAIPDYDHEDGQVEGLLLDYYTILENMVGSTLDRMYYTYYADGGRKKKKRNKRNKRKGKKKSVKKNKKGKRKTKRKIYGRKR